MIGENIPCTISRQADKYVQLATVCMDMDSSSKNTDKKDGDDQKQELTEDKNGATTTTTKNDSVMYLFKVKTIEEADTLQKQLNDCVGSNGTSSSSGDDKEDTK